MIPFDLTIAEEREARIMGHGNVLSDQNSMKRLFSARGTELVVVGGSETSGRKYTRALAGP